MDEYISKSLYPEYELNHLVYAKTTLLVKKNIFLIRAFNVDHYRKKYIKNVSIIVEDFIYTSSFCETQLFMEEINLFDKGNLQNNYMKISEIQGIKSLALELPNKKMVYLSKSEAKAIYKIFNISFMGYTLSRLLEDESILTEDILIKILLNDVKGLNNGC